MFAESSLPSLVRMALARPRSGCNHVLWQQSILDRMDSGTTPKKAVIVNLSALWLLHGRWAHNINRSCWQKFLTKERRLLFIEGVDWIFLSQSPQLLGYLCCESIFTRAIVLGCRHFAVVGLSDFNRQPKR